MLDEYHDITQNLYEDMMSTDSKIIELRSRSQAAEKNLQTTIRTHNDVSRLRSELNQSMQGLLDVETDYVNSQNVYASDKRKLLSELAYIEKEFTRIQEKLDRRRQEVTVPSTITAKETRNNHWLDLVGAEYENQPILQN